MRISVIVPLVVGVSVVVGVWVGRTTAAEPPAAEGSRTKDASPSVATRRAARGLVCAQPRRRGTAGSDGCEEESLRVRWCEAQLEQHARQRRAVRQPWPEVDGAEDPERWTEVVEEALAECELGAELELVECTEYPCVAALRPADPDLDEEAREAEMKRLMGQARACGSLRQAFGVTEPAHEEALDVYRLDARCGDGRESFYVLSALAVDGPAWALQNKEHRTEIEERDLSRWIYRRADDVSAMWPCEE